MRRTQRGRRNPIPKETAPRRRGRLRRPHGGGPDVGRRAEPDAASGARGRPRREQGGPVLTRGPGPGAGGRRGGQARAAAPPSEGGEAQLPERGACARPPCGPLGASGKYSSPAGDARRVCGGPAVAQLLTPARAPQPQAAGPARRPQTPALRPRPVTRGPFPPPRSADLPAPVLLAPTALRFCLRLKKRDVPPRPQGCENEKARRDGSRAELLAQGSGRVQEAPGSRRTQRPWKRSH